MRAPRDARAVICRISALSVAPTVARVGFVIGTRVHLWNGCRDMGMPSCHPNGRRLAEVEIVRDATARERVIGMAL